MWELFHKGGWAMYPLLLCSLVALTVILERAWFWWKNREGNDLPERILSLLKNGETSAALQQAGQGNSPLIRVLVAGLEHRSPSPVEAMEATAMHEIGCMKRYLPALDTIVTLAPLLGLLGTIFGMVAAFKVMSLSGIGDPHAVTGGVAEALIATATGLLVAIVTLVPYNYFLSRIERTTDQIEEWATRFTVVLQQRNTRFQSPSQRNGGSVLKEPRHAASANT